MGGAVELELPEVKIKAAVDGTVDGGTVVGGTDVVVEVVVVGPQAEFVGGSLRKGRPVLVEGSLRTEE